MPERKQGVLGAMLMVLSAVFVLLSLGLCGAGLNSPGHSKLFPIGIVFLFASAPTFVIGLILVLIRRDER